MINFVLDCIYKKSVETCLAHHITGIAKHHQENELRNKYPTLSHIWIKVYSHERLYTPLHMQRQNERRIVLIPLR